MEHVLVVLQLLDLLLSDGELISQDLRTRYVLIAIVLLIVVGVDAVDIGHGCRLTTESKVAVDLPVIIVEDALIIVHIVVVETGV